jgi:heptosyltransferase I
MKILVVKMTSMGDVVHTLPAITDMARQFPGVQIDWLVEAPFAGIVRLHPQVRRVIAVSLRKWRKSWWKRDTRAAAAAARQVLQSERYDLIIDFQGLLKSAWWARKALGPSAGYDRASIREPLAAMLYARTAAVSRRLDAVTRNRQLAAQHLGYAVQSAPDFGIAAPPGSWTAPAHYAVLMPAASRPEKLWPEPDWLAAAAALKARELTAVFLWGSADEQARAQRLADAAGGTVPPFLSVTDAAAVLDGARIVVGLDTGFTHLAAALGTPAIGIYCDHDPGLAAVTGRGFTASLGGKGAPPTRAAVLAAIDQALGSHG